MNELPVPDKIIDIDLPKVAKKELYLTASRLSFYYGLFILY